MKNFNVLRSEHPPFLLGVGWGGGGWLNLLPNFQKQGTGRGLAVPSFLEGVGGKEQVTFVRGVLQFLHKNKI